MVDLQTVYVIDSYSLMALSDIVPIDAIDDVLYALIDFVKDGTIRYPELVWRECGANRDEAGVALWTKSVAGYLAKDKPGYECSMEVLDLCPDLLDAEAGGWQPQVEVAALAHYLRSPGGSLSVTVVTDDDRPRPDRMELAKACSELGLPTINAKGLLSTLDITYPV